MGIIAGVIWWYQQPHKIPLGVPVHMHAGVDIWICGEHKDLPHAGNETTHGKKFLGIHLMHTHDDNVIHIEGVINKYEDITLGRFFDAINVPFAEDKILNVTNGDMCNGKPATLKMFVNHKENAEFKNYVPFATTDPREQVITLVFDS